MNKKRDQIRTVAEQTVFQVETGFYTPVHFRILSTITFGLLKLSKLDMSDKKIYLIDVGFNDILVYDQSSGEIGDRSMTFWRLGLDGAPDLKGESISASFEREIDLNDIPCFDPNYKERGSWVTTNYIIRAKLRVEQVQRLRDSVNPDTTILDRVRATARPYLAARTYEQIQRDDSLKTPIEIKAQLNEDPDIKGLGIRIEAIVIEGTQSEELRGFLRESWKRLVEAEDRRSVGEMFANMPLDAYIRMLAEKDSKVFIETRNRMFDNLAIAAVMQGINPLRSLDESIPRGLGASEPNMTAQRVQEFTSGIVDVMSDLDEDKRDLAERILDKVPVDDWPVLEPPQQAPHHERLEWEQQVMQKRAPTRLEITGLPSTFRIRLNGLSAQVASDNNPNLATLYLEVHWPSPESRPVVYINSKNMTVYYSVLPTYKYPDDYGRITIWQIYVETQLGTQNRQRVLDSYYENTEE